VGSGNRRRGSRVFTSVRWLVRLGFLALFALLAFRAAYPPLETPQANLMLRFDPLAGIYSFLTSGSASTLAAFWPAWVLLGITLLSSRFFCGWICPLGTCFDIAGSLKPRVLKYYQPRGKVMKALLARQKRGTAARRIRLKYFILAVVLALGLVGVNLLYFASPLVIMNRSLYLLFLPQVPVLLLILLLVAFVYRPRFWCDDLCPMGALMSMVSMAGKRLSASVSPLSIVKDRDACIECGACYKACDFGVAEPFLKQDSGRLRSADCTACGECVAACPSGGALALESIGVPFFTSRGAQRHPAYEKSHAAEAPGGEAQPERGPKLTVTRGEFIGSLGLGAVLLAGYGLGVREVSGPVLRMPGAQDEARFLAACNRCAECMRACPVECIRPMGLEDGFGKLMTPRFEPRRAGCIYDQCDQACARVCPVNAIEVQKPEEVKIGLAHVNRQSCLGWKGRPCLVCQERCRFNAIENSGLKPVVVEDKCTGCGACEQTCPTQPTSIAVYRTAESPSWPSGSGGGGGGRRGGK
jgi:ferredoxin